MKKESNQKIKKDMLISELVEKYPQIAEVLVMDYGFHCIGCMMGEMETLEQGAAVHGMDGTDIEVMIENLNELLAGTKV